MQLAQRIAVRGETMKAQMPRNLRETSLIGVQMNGLRSLGFLGQADFPALAMFLGGVWWFECCWSSYPEEDWIAT